MRHYDVAGGPAAAVAAAGIAKLSAAVLTSNIRRTAASDSAFAPSP